MSATLMQANHQWATRPADERFTNLYAMQDHFDDVRNHSRAITVASRTINARPCEDNRGLLIAGASGVEYAPTHSAFGQLAQLAGAPVRFLEEIQPALMSFANSSQHSVKAAVEHAQSARLDNVDEWLAKRFGARNAQKIKGAHMADEGRPIETRWDVVTGVTAYARNFANQDARVELETEAGKILQAA